ncbi:MAG TPA: hypothetical protein VKE22_17940 [Haliangiales bacterium]|nr:hypothetical protein [Haliangiales bacterium]
MSCHRARGGDRIPSIWGRGAARSTQTGKGAAAVGIAANAWYRLEVLVVGTTITVTLYDDKGTQVDQLAEFADRATIQGGVAFGVAGSAVLDTITWVDGQDFTAFAGSGGTAAYYATCPPGTVVTGMFGNAAAAVDLLGLHCGTITPDAAAPGGYTIAPSGDIPAQGGPNPNPFDAPCGGRGIVTGVTVLVDTSYTPMGMGGFQLTCTEYDLAGGPGTYRLVNGASHQTAKVGAAQGADVYSPVVLPCTGGRGLTMVRLDVGPWPVYNPFTVMDGISGMCRDVTPN